MKRLVKRILKTGWRATAPVRRPFARRLEAYLRRIMDSRDGDETAVVLDHVVREMLRLQDRIARLQDSVDDLADAQGRLAVVDGSHARREAV